jgi:KAP family P-loop domain
VTDQTPKAEPSRRFHSDNPIRTTDEDRLGIAPFVRRLRPVLLNAPIDSSIVLGLYGEWGSGKSSALNLLENVLVQTQFEESHTVRRGPQAQVVRFTPWLYTGVESLLTAFFATLAEGVGGFDGSPGKTKRKWEASLKAMSVIVGPALALGGAAYAASGSGTHGLIAGVAGSAAHGIAELFAKVGDLIKGGGGGLAAFLSVSEVSFHKSKAEASKILRSLGEQGAPQRVVVLIDDLDRCASADEVLAMLKLIRLVADLPNVSYVIAMDRHRVETILRDAVSDSFGAEFLGKIVQIPVALPKAASRTLTRILIEDVAAIAAAARLNAEVLKVDWSGWAISMNASYATLLFPCIRTLRDVARVSNMFRLAVMSDSPPEVHAVDMLLLCVLQCVYPATYEKLQEHASFLLNDELESDVFDSSAEARGRRGVRGLDRLRAIAGLSSDASPDISAPVVAGRLSRQQRLESPALAILTELFPYALETSVGDVNARQARDELRIRSPERFDAYFRYHVAPGAVSQRQAMA